MHKIKKIIKEMFSKKRELKEINNITYNKLQEMLRENTETILLDVRSPQEYKEWHLRTAMNIPEYELSSKANNIIKNKNIRIIVYCKSGARSKRGIKILKNLGYTNLYNLEGGIEGIN